MLFHTAKGVYCRTSRGCSIAVCPTVLALWWHADWLTSEKARLLIRSVFRVRIQSAGCRMSGRVKARRVPSNSIDARAWQECPKQLQKADEHARQPAALIGRGWLLMVVGRPSFQAARSGFWALATKGHSTGRAADRAAACLRHWKPHRFRASALPSPPQRTPSRSPAYTCSSLFSPNAIGISPLTRYFACTYHAKSFDTHIANICVRYWSQTTLCVLRGVAAAALPARGPPCHRPQQTA